MPDRDHYIVYGYREIPGKLRFLSDKNGIRNTSPSAAVNSGQLPNEAAAGMWLMEHLLQEGPSIVHAVVVKLEEGRDENGKRHVVRRVGNGKAWWE